MRDDEIAVYREQHSGARALHEWDEEQHIRLPVQEKTEGGDLIAEARLNSQSLSRSIDRVIGLLSLISSLVFLAAGISAPLLLKLPWLSEFLQFIHHHNTFFRVRFDDLAQIDQKWADQYFAVFLLFPLASVVAVICFVRAAVKNLSDDSPKIKIGSNLGGLLIKGFFICAFIVYVFLFQDFSIHLTQYRGKAAIFATRAFPVFAAVGSILIGFILSSVLVVAIRAVLQRGKS